MLPNIMVYYNSNKWDYQVSRNRNIFELVENNQQAYIGNMYY